MKRALAAVFLLSSAWTCVRAGPPGVDLAALQAARAEIEAAPEGEPRRDLLGALDAVREKAARLKPGPRQQWIDGHLGDFNEALRTLGPNAPQELVRKAVRAAARLNAGAERWADAREFSEKALSFDPDDRDALIDRSRANAGLSDFARAYADADRAAGLAPDSADAYTARAGAAYGLGNYLQALEDARRALALDPGDQTAFALMKLSEGRTRKIAGFEETEPSRLADTVEREYHGLVQQMNQVEEERRAPAPGPSPGATRRLVASAGAKLSVRDYWGAIEDADKALALSPTDARALYFRAAGHNLVGDYGAAARDATRGLTVTPSDPALRDARAWAYNRMGRYDDATADAHWALETDPRDPYAFANRAYADERRGDYPAMLADYKAAAALNPQFEPTYADAARRHDLTTQPPRGPDDSLLTAARTRRARTFAALLASSLLGGLLIALGVLHAGTLKKKGAESGGGWGSGYVLGRPIGQGGMGVVYEAFDKRLRRPVAVKMLRDEYTLDADAKAGFLAEARVVAELRHPAIVAIHDVLEDERGLYLVFERLDGRTLDRWLEERRSLTLPEIKDVLRPVCEALEYAHARGVVHRDLKPANIMLTPGGVKVLDFGISRRAERAGAAAVTRTVVGTPHYMAPEQEYGVVRRENDVFSLGAMLYEMLVGARPYEDAHQAKLARGYRRASTRVPGVPLALDALIDRALEPDPDRRLPSPAEFWRQLDEISALPAPAAA